VNTKLWIKVEFNEEAFTGRIDEAVSINSKLKGCQCLTAAIMKEDEPLASCDTIVEYHDPTSPTATCELQSFSDQISDRVVALLDSG
jgi:hypothetical protein